jgi:hypothetical protein
MTDLFAIDLPFSLELDLLQIARRHDLSRSSNAGALFRALPSLAPGELKTCSKALRALPPSRLRRLVADKAAVTRVAERVIEAHPGHPGNTLALLKLGVPTPELRIRLPDIVCEALRCEICAGEEEHAIRLIEAGPGAPSYPIRLDALPERHRLEIEVGLLPEPEPFGEALL